MIIFITYIARFYMLIWSNAHQMPTLIDKLLFTNLAWLGLGLGLRHPDRLRNRSILGNVFATRPAYEFTKVVSLEPVHFCNVALYININKTKGKPPARRSFNQHSHVFRYFFIFIKQYVSKVFEYIERRKYTTD